MGICDTSSTGASCGASAASSPFFAFLLTLGSASEDMYQHSEKIIQREEIPRVGFACVAGSTDRAPSTSVMSSVMAAV